MDYPAATLEQWLRWRYFEADVDIGGSGVLDLSVGELRVLLGIGQAELDAVVLRDSSSYGSAPLRRAMARRWGNGDPDWMMPTHGASEAIFLVMSTLLEAGDELVALEPAYHSHTSIARTLGCTVRPWRLSAGRGFEPDIDELARLVTPRTRAIVVNFPHNPTGVTITAAQQQALVSIAAEAGAYLVWDAAFTDLVYDKPPLPDPTLEYRDAISVGTLSKAYGLPGLRFGWCSAHPDTLARLVNLRDMMTLHLSPLVEHLACRVAARADDLVRMHLERARGNLAVLRRWARDHHGLVDLVEPRGGVTVFPRLPGHADTEPLCEALLRRHRVLLVPGNCFGDPSRVRLGFGGATKGLERGLAALSRTLAGEQDAPVESGPNVTVPLTR